ncbi:MAG: glycosyltransferase, partial [Cellulomonadaceae bacterium]|nr:glycosyltransferase [Cellulomonadaceae bacterium]
MKIAVVKPDWRIRGGFEVVVDRIESDLRGAGHQVERVEVDVPALAREAFGVVVPDPVWDRAPEWFSHHAMLAKFRSLDLSAYDLVLSTQPPSYAVSHPRHLAFFYHHARAFYDLEDVWIAAGRAPEVLHRTAAAMLRAAEAEDLAHVTHFLAGSERVAERLRHFQGPDTPVSVYTAPAPTPDPVDQSLLDHVLVVSRHEFTKRTELAVQAFALGRTRGVLVGGGGRLEGVRSLSADLASGSRDARTLTARELWLNDAVPAAATPGDGLANVSIVGRVEDDELDRLYGSALCVLAPAYDEDYGLTVLEAMSRGRAVIVCRDGGGLTAFVEHGVNGFVVEPDAAAIAEAVARLAGDHDLARRMGAAARRTAELHTAAAAREQLLAAVELVAGSAA